VTRSAGAGASEIHLVVEADGSGLRLDRYLTAMTGFSRARVQKLIADSQVFVNGQAPRSSHKLRPGEQVIITIPEPKNLSLAPEEIPLDVVYEDSDLLVINKQRGLVVHPAAGHAHGTLVNAVLARCPDLAAINDVVRPGIIHRLDKDTTGLMMVAKNEFTQKAMAAAVKSHRVSREYLALVFGEVTPERGLVDAPIGRHPLDRKKMAVVDGGRDAVTHFRVAESFRGYSLLRLRLETGRTHQIRVHMVFIGHPVVGDPVYGKRSPGEADAGEGIGAAVRLLKGQALHSASLAFTHPRTGAALAFDAPPPPDFAALLEALRQSGT
jgi:23S rRNA pseudouridine1911/1915/1917 synthase